MTKRKTAEESAHMGRIAEMPCAVCSITEQPQDGATCVHHIRDGAGLSQRSSHFLTVPLCYYHHQGGGGIHKLGTRLFETRYKLSELDLLAFAISQL